MMAIQSYRDLEVWKQSIDLAVKCYETTRQFPKDELYGLTSQIRRCATSIPANIAEGNGRQHTKEYIHFLSVANGSLRELETHMILSQRIGILDETQSNEILNVTNSIGRMIVGLRQSLQRRLT